MALEQEEMALNWRWIWHSIEHTHKLQNLFKQKNLINHIVL